MRREARVILALSGCMGAACAASPKAGPEAARNQALAKAKLSKGDSSRCEHERSVEREVVETRTLGSLKSNIRRVYRLIGTEGQRKRVLLCREVDSNLDGIKDVVRQYNDRGEPIEERADANYDGVIDTWIHYIKGRVVQVEIDDAWDGQPDETRYYAAGKLTRIARDTNHDGKADVWEVYIDGHLDRIGLDTNYDGRVDRWNRDVIAGDLRRKALEEAAPPAAPAAEELR
jgi:hypothetical protein